MLKTQRIIPQKAKEYSINRTGFNAPITWIKLAINDFVKRPSLAIFYGIFFAIASYICWATLVSTPALQDLAAPILAILILILGPISTMSLYDASHKIQAIDSAKISDVIKTWFRSKWSCTGIGLSMLLLLIVILWMILTPLIYVVFSSANNVFSNPDEELFLRSILQDSSLIFMLSFITYTGVLSLISFIISWFFTQMVLDEYIDPYTAIIISLQVAMQNKILMLVWIPTVCVTIGVSLFTPYFVGMAVTVPILAYAIWYAYANYLFRKNQTIKQGLCFKN